MARSPTRLIGRDAMTAFAILLPIAMSMTSSMAASGGSMEAFRTFPVYHINPKHLGALPINMDVADLRGDIFFDLSARTLPLACANGSAAHMSHHDCSNAETTDPDVVYSKVTLHVRETASFGEYAACNVCPKSGIDDYSKLPCTPERYICTCRVGTNGTWPWRLERCDEHADIGRQDVAQYFKDWPPCSWDTWQKAPYACWWLPVVNVTGGTWYSTTRGGWCDAPGANHSTCTWHASVDKVVNKSCSDDIVHTAVEAYDAAHDGCFGRCPTPPSAHRRNTSSPCWIYCLFATIVGPSALVPGGRQKVDAMPLRLLEEAFERPFAAEAEGGCPAL